MSLIEAIEGGVHIGQFLIDWGANRRGCSCRIVFNKKRVLIEGGMHVGSLSIEKECEEKAVHAGKLYHEKVV